MSELKQKTKKEPLFSKKNRNPFLLLFSLQVFTDLIVFQKIEELSKKFLFKAKLNLSKNMALYLKMSITQ